MPVCETMPEVGLSPTMGTNTAVAILATPPAQEPQKSDHPMDTPAEVSLPGGDEHLQSKAAGGEEPMVTAAGTPAGEPSSLDSPGSMEHPSQEEDNQMSEGDQPEESSHNSEYSDSPGEEKMGAEELTSETPAPTDKPETGAVMQGNAGPSRGGTSGGAQVTPTEPTHGPRCKVTLKKYPEVVKQPHNQPTLVGQSRAHVPVGGQYTGPCLRAGITYPKVKLELAPLQVNKYQKFIQGKGLVVQDWMQQQIMDCHNARMEGRQVVLRRQRPGMSAL